MGDVNLAQARQWYRSAVVDSDENAHRLLSLGVGAALMVLLMTAPVLGPLLQWVWVGASAALLATTTVMRRGLVERLRQALLEQQLQRHLPLDMELWHRIGAMRELPAPLNTYVEHMLATYLDLCGQVPEGEDVELGQVHAIEARDQVWDFLDLAERTGAIRTVLETHGQRISDEDKVLLRQRFSEQCAGLQQIAQSFDRSVGSLAVARVLSEELGETSIETVAERMHDIEQELEEVKRSISVETT